jgi:hypothetical protein
MELKLSDVVVGERIRSDVGDLSQLMASIDRDYPQREFLYGNSYESHYEHYVERLTKTLI